MTTRVGQRLPVPEATQLGPNGSGTTSGRARLVRRLARGRSGDPYATDATHLPIVARRRAVVSEAAGTEPSQAPVQPAGRPRRPAGNGLAGGAQPRWVEPGVAGSLEAGPQDRRQPLGTRGRPGPRCVGCRTRVAGLGRDQQAVVSAAQWSGHGRSSGSDFRSTLVPDPIRGNRFAPDDGVDGEGVADSTGFADGAGDRPTGSTRTRP